MSTLRFLGNISVEPINEVFQFCASKNLPRPVFNCEEPIEAPANQNYEFSAQVGSVVCTGKGKTKKLAKKITARSLLLKLKSMGDDIDKLTAKEDVILTGIQKEKLEIVFQVQQ